MSNIQLPLGELGSAKLPVTDWERQAKLRVKAIENVSSVIDDVNLKRSDYILWWHNVLMGIKGTWSGPLKG